MILGAEFHRHVWQRFSLFSLLLMPVLIGLGMGMSYLSFLVHDEARTFERLINPQTIGHYAVDPHWSFRSLFISLPMMLITLFLYGISEAASSFTSELRNKTWDLPKTSAIRPIHLAFGKLFGTTSGAWYFGLGLLAVILYAYANMFQNITPKPVAGNLGPVEVILKYPTILDVASFGLCIMASAFVGHLVATLGSLQCLAKKKTGSFTSMAYGIAGSFATYVFLSMILAFPQFKQASLIFRSPVGGEIMWFGVSFDLAAFCLYSILFFVSCGLLGLHRMARQVLSFQSYPFVWIAFLTALSLYFIGFNTVEFVQQDLKGLNSSVSQLFMFPFFIFMMATFSSLSGYSSDLGGYLRFLAARKRQNNKRILETIPVWIPTGAITFVILVVWLIAEGSTSNGLIPFSMKFSFLVSLFLFMIRDGLVMHALLLGNRFRRGGLLVGLYFAFAYLILPGFAIMFSALGTGGTSSFISKVAAHPESYGYLLGLFYPSPQLLVSPAINPVILQVMICVYFLWRVTAVYRQKAGQSAK